MKISPTPTATVENPDLEITAESKLDSDLLQFFFIQNNQHRKIEIMQVITVKEPTGRNIKTIRLGFLGKSEKVRFIDRLALAVKVLLWK